MFVSNHCGQKERWDKTTWLVEAATTLYKWETCLVDQQFLLDTARSNRIRSEKTNALSSSFFPFHVGTSFLDLPPIRRRRQIPYTDLDLPLESVNYRFVHIPHRIHITKKYNYDRNFAYPNGAFFGYFFAGCLSFLNHVVPFPWPPLINRLVAHL